MGSESMPTNDIQDRLSSVLPTLSTQPAKRAVPIGELIIDFVLGWCSFYVPFVGAFALSGPFDLRGWPFFACQAGILVTVYLGVGYLRGRQ
jgi:hypothetical protein